MQYNRHGRELHVMALRTDSNFLGNAICLFMFSDVLNDAPREDRFVDAWRDIISQDHLRQTESQFQKLELLMVLEERGSPNSSYQLLRGKASETLHFIPIICLILEKHRRNTIPYECHVLQCLQGLFSFCKCLDYRLEGDVYLMCLPSYIREQFYADAIQRLNFCFLVIRFPPPYWHTTMECNTKGKCLLALRI